MLNILHLVYMDVLFVKCDAVFIETVAAVLQHRAWTSKKKKT